MACPASATSYPVKVADKTILFCHKEIGRRDRIVQESERVDIYVDGKIIRADGVEAFRAKYNLPHFGGLRIYDWHLARGKILRRAATDEQEKRFFRVHEYCRQSGVSILQAARLAMKMRPGSIIKARLDALSIAAFLLSLKSPGNEGFYLAQGAGGKQENKEYVDKILAAMRAGNIGIRSAKVGENNIYGFAEGGYILYDQQDNMLTVSMDLDPSDFWTQMALAHELDHTYRDGVRRPMVHRDSEVAAYIRAGEYAIYARHFYDKTAAQFEAAITDQNFKQDLSEADIQGIRVAYYRRIGDAAIERSARAALGKAVLDRYHYRMFVTASFDHAYENATGNLSEVYQKKAMTEAKKQIDARAAAALEDVRRYLFARTIDQDELIKKIVFYFSVVGTYPLLQKFYLAAEQVESSGGSLASFKAEAHLIDLDVPDMQRAFTALPPEFAGHIRIKYDGLKKRR